jgi:peptidyl-prolyl cis-trans isomerase A (cyclophilin A)
VLKSRAAFVLMGILIVAPGATACGGDAEPPVDDTNPLMRPSSFTETAPDEFRASFETSRGTFVVRVEREWAPNGADRFYNLVKSGYYDDVRFFRVIESFMAQFGMNGDPYVTAVWSDNAILDDPVTQSNLRGRITFAMTGQPNSRTTQAFINLVDNTQLDDMGFAPIGEVVEGMDVVDALYSGYGEGAPRGDGPIQQNIRARGNEYLAEDFPELDYVVTARILEG